jgi:hypothetical protein
LSTKQPSSELNAAIKQYFIDASFPSIDKIYDPDRPNTFIATPTNSTVAPKRKRNIAHLNLFEDWYPVLRRQAAIPAGCVKKNSTSLPSTNSTGSGYGDYSSGSSRSAGYGDYSGSSTRSAGYGGYPGGYASLPSVSTRTPTYDGYGYPGSNPSSKRISTITTPAGSVPSVPCITKTITDFTYETVTKCSGTNNYCQMGSVVTKTSVRTTVITLSASVTPATVTVKSASSSAPGQGYNVPPNSNKPPVSKPAQSSVPAVSNPVYGTPVKASSSAPVNQPVKSSGSPAIPVSPSRATNDVYSVPTYSASTGLPKNGTRSSGTPTGYYPAQFTGAAATERAVLSLVAFVVALTPLAFIL